MIWQPKSKRWSYSASSSSTSPGNLAGEFIYSQRIKTVPAMCFYVALELPWTISVSSAAGTVPAPRRGGTPARVKTSNLSVTTTAASRLSASPWLLWWGPSSARPHQVCTYSALDPTGPHPLYVGSTAGHMARLGQMQSSSDHTVQSIPVYIWCTLNLYQSIILFSLDNI